MLSRFSLRAALFLLLLLPCLVGQAQRTASVVMLSDIHFDPFHDPAKLSRLRKEPIEHWAAILGAAPSPTQGADLQALQSACGARALDTAWPLLQTALAAAHDAEPRPAFVILSGDLLTHEFPCRFTHSALGTSSGDIAAFAAKTVAFVLGQSRGAFPRIPVYAALGNNDSGCADYRATPADPFQTNTSATLAAAAGIQPSSFTPEGDYSVPLPAPIEHGRLIVLQDIFEARQFNTCGAAADRAPQKAQVDWLRAQLTAARAHHEQVWVMAHMPPGVDVYTSFRRYVFQPTQLCNAEPRPFLADTSLADALLDYADIVRLTLFGHTHMDEIRLLRRSTPDNSKAPSNTETMPSRAERVSYNSPSRSVAVFYSSSSRPQRVSYNSSSRPEAAGRSGETPVFAPAQAQIPSPSTPSSRPEPRSTSSDLSSRPERSPGSPASALAGVASAVERSAVSNARAEGASQPPAIPAKLIPSVTPVFGNHPAFLVAAVDPQTATLKDWRAIVSPGPDGSTPPWTEAYRYSSTYHLPDFSAGSIAKLADAFTADRTGQSSESSAFRQHFYPGDIGLYALGLAQIWPAYACTVREDRPSAVHTCICSTAPKPEDPH